MSKQLEKLIFNNANALEINDCNLINIKILDDSESLPIYIASVSIDEDAENDDSFFTSLFSFNEAYEDEQEEQISYDPSSDDEDAENDDSLFTSLFSFNETYEDEQEEQISGNPSSEKDACKECCCETCNPHCHVQKNIFSIWGSFIYWQPRQSFMDIALESASPELINDCYGESWEGGKRVQLTPDYHPGFKVGMEFGHAYWKAFADYTRFRFENRRSIHVHDEGFVFARWIQPGVVINNSVNRLKVKWAFNMNVLNVELGKRCDLDRFIFKPHFGLATAWIDQRFKGRFSLISPVNFLKAFNTSDSWGIGPRTGVDIDLKLASYLSIIGNVAADLLYTHYNLDLHQHSPTDSTLFVTVSDHIQELRAELEMYLGFNCHFPLSSQSHLNLQIGYDFQIWWNQNMIRWHNDSGWTSAPEGNLYLQGLRFTLGFDF